LLTRPPLSSTLFPYTTLFRSISISSGVLGLPTAQPARLFLQGSEASQAGGYVLDHLRQLLCDLSRKFARAAGRAIQTRAGEAARSEEHTSELQSRSDLVCRLL